MPWMIDLNAIFIDRDVVGGFYLSTVVLAGIF